MRVLEKAGFTRDAVLRSAATKDGLLIDTVLYSRVITRSGRPAD
jgi:[ribosomal protein S5]-alanine N-acetyltransferase